MLMLSGQPAPSVRSDVNYLPTCLLTPSARFPTVLNSSEEGDATTVQSRYITGIGTSVAIRSLNHPMSLVCGM